MMTGSTIVDFLFSLMRPRFYDVVGKRGERESPRLIIMQIQSERFFFDGQ